MTFNFLNLAIRFFLEMISLIVVGMYGWRLSETSTKYIYGIGLPLVLAIAWGVFNVPGDPSRSGNAPVVVTGFVRLMIELLFFACGAYALISLNYRTAGIAFICIVVVHYLVSFDRISWLLKQ